MGLCSLSICAQTTKNKKMTYPITNKVAQEDVYFGTKVQDPYRWLENDRSPETEAWVKEQNKLTFDYLSQIPFRENLKQQMQAMWNYEKISAPFVEGNYTYYYKNNGLQNQSVLYRKDKQNNETIFLDPNLFSKDGTSSLGGVYFSKDGTKVAYAISEGGSDWRIVKVIDAETLQSIDGTLTDIKFSGISWLGNDGFYYSSYDKPKGSELSAKTDQHKLYYHKLGTPQTQDQLVYGNNVKKRYVSGSVTDDQNYLIITASNNTSGNELYIKDLKNPTAHLITIAADANYDYDVLDNKGNQFFMITNYQAPNKQLMAFDSNQPQMTHWKTIIPETKNVLTAATGGGFVFAQYIKDAVSVVKQFDYSGKEIQTVTLPGIGTAAGFSGKETDQQLFFTFTNYTTPSTIYQWNIAQGKAHLYAQPKVLFDGSEYETKQVFYTSKDGTKVPMIIVHKKGLLLNGKTPTMLYGYGGFNISLTPNFSVPNAVWLQNGGVYAVANLRGGGEYGRAWHDAGTQMKKQNVFDDFIAAAEYLIKEKYTSSDYLAISGRSNGGLLVGATLTQRPDLVKVALPGVGVLDMLRYHTFTAGAGWAYDYGTAEQSKEMFDYLYNYSPVHAVKKGIKYPSTLVTTGDHDDRVVPAHSFKFGAQLQDKHAGKNPVLVRIDVNAGHGAGKSVAASIAEFADIQAFTLFEMGIKKL